MKKNRLLIILVIAIIFISISNIVLAGFTDYLKSDTQLPSTNEVVSKLNEIIGIVQIIGVGIAIITLMALAIKYMVSSIGDRAEIKKHAVVYVVGAVFLFGTSGLLQIVKTFAGSMLQ